MCLGVWWEEAEHRERPWALSKSFNFQKVDFSNMKHKESHYKEKKER